MLKRAAHAARMFLWSECAQTTVEYALVVSVTVAVLLTVSGVVLDGLGSFYRAVTSVICLPIP